MVSETSRISLPELKLAVKQINDYFDQLKKIYVGRDKVIDTLKYAMLSKTHVLYFGVPGTSKTAIANSLFASITHSATFAVQMTAFMAEDALFGPYNIKKMRDEGVLMHNTEKMLPEANFDILDEFLDANPAVMRSLLSTLNERQMVKGRQVLDIPLHLAYCSTNVDPYVFLQRNPQAWAVLDRIGFIDRVDYLSNAEDVTEMVKRFQYRTSTTPKETLELGVINSIADYIVLPPTLIQDQLILMKYGEAIVEYRARRIEKMKELEQKAAQARIGVLAQEVDYQGMMFRDISDRRVCQASQLMEISAVLAGRISVKPEDMLLCSHMLGTSELEEEMWKEIVTKKIDEISQLKKNKLSELQLKQLQNLKDQFEDIRGNGHDLDTRVNGVATLYHQITELHPENDQVAEVFESLKNEVGAYKEKIGKELLESKGLGTTN